MTANTPTFIFGTRPEAIKIAPVVEELRVLGVQPRLICTGQHTDLLEGTPMETTLQTAETLPTFRIGSIFEWLLDAQIWMPGDLKGPLVVQGDTISAFAGAQWALTEHYPLWHIEAGIRSHGPEPWPEEDIRIGISGLADIHFCATEQNKKNLEDENISGTESVFVTGNPVVSMLAKTGLTHTPTKPWTVMITLHRRELRAYPGLRDLIQDLFRACSQWPDIRFVWPVHPAMSDVVFVDGRPDNLELCKPLGYQPFTRALAECVAVITDSGGVVEEAVTLGVPTAVFRNHNDRPEANGVLTKEFPYLDSIGRAVAFSVSSVFHNSQHGPTTIFGDPNSARRIAEKMVEML